MEDQRHYHTTPPSTPSPIVATTENLAATAPTTDEDRPPSSPMELPLTPQSNNRGTSISIPDEEIVLLMAKDVGMAEEELDTEGGNDPPSPMMLAGGGVVDEHDVDTRFARNLSALSASASSASVMSSLYEDEHAQQRPLEQQEDADSRFARNMLPLSSASSALSSFYEDDHVQERLRRQRQEDGFLTMCYVNGSNIDTPRSSSISSLSRNHPQAVAVPSTGTSTGALPSKAVDWIPQQQHSDGTMSGMTSQAAVGADDVTETSFTTLTTYGEQQLQPQQQRSTRVPPASSLLASRLARSPRAPPRHMRAVDWCPNAVGGGGGGGGVGGGGGGVDGGSDKTAVTSRAVRLGDDATVTTFATMTTMGDAGSILLLEADTEEEASSSSGGGGNASSGLDEEILKEGGEEEDDDAEDNDEAQSTMLEYVKDENKVVDKIPAKTRTKTAMAHHRTPTMKSKNSVATNRAVRGFSSYDDQSSVVTFATMDGNNQAGDDVVDKVPSSMPLRKVSDITSMVTTDAVLMGDNLSLATSSWNTTGGQLTGNVVDHVPVMGSSYDGNADNKGEGLTSEMDGGRNVGVSASSLSSSNITVCTSNAIKDDASLLTLVTSAADDDNLSAIDEVVDNIPTFAGGGGRSIASGITSQAVRFIGRGGGGGGDDRSVASFGTMTTMGDLGSIIETAENLEDEDDYGDMDVHTSSQQVHPYFQRYRGSSLSATLVDVIPEATPSVASGTTNHSVREPAGEDYDDDASVDTFGTMTTSRVMSDPKKLICLVSKGCHHRQQSVNQQRALDWLASRKVPYTIVDGMDPEQREERDKFFRISAIRGNYPQFFFEFQDGQIDFLGSFDKMETLNETNGLPLDFLAQRPELVTWAKMFGSVVESFDGRVEVEQNDMNYTSERARIDGDAVGDVVDHVPTYPTNGGSSTSIVSGMTDRAVRLNDDQSVATWVTAATSGVAGTVVVGRINEPVVDKIPSFSSHGYGGAEYAAGEEDLTNCAVKNPDDQSVATWNTMTTATSGMGARSASTPPPPTLMPGRYAVDRLPSFANKGLGMGASLSGTTNHAIRVGGGDDQSVVTFATITTAGCGGMDRGGIGGGGVADTIVDKVPLFVPPQRVSSIVTNESVQMGDNQSLATWGTTNTMGQQLTGNVIDHIPTSSSFDSKDDRTVGTTNALKEDHSVTTLATSATYWGGVSCIDEVVDKIPTFSGGAGRSVMSGVTNQAIRDGDDRSVLSFTTMSTAGGDLVSPHDIQLDSSTNSSRRYRYSNNVVDHIPASAGRRDTTSIVSGRTDNAIRLGDDSTFATLTSAAGEEDLSNAPTRGEESNDGMLASISSRGMTAPPATSVLRSALKSRTHSGSAVAVGGAEMNELPIDVGESVSNTHILRAIADLKLHVDYRIGEMRELNRRDSDRVLQIVQQEQTKRTALEARLHSQLLLQSESMVAMELKLLRIEAKVALRDSRRQQRRQPAIADRLPPIAATPSTPNRSDEEMDSFDELELTPRGTNRQGAGSGLFTHGGLMHRSGGPANIAVVTRSGASVASAVTATSFQEGDFANANDGDIEDEVEDNDDVSESTPTQTSRNRISNLESILLNPIQGAGSNDQGISTRAVRGDNTDGMSSLPTSVTSATIASTVVTSTSRGNESVASAVTATYRGRMGITQVPSSRASEEDVLPEGVTEEAGVHSNSEDFDSSAEVVGQPERQPRSRSQSPLTVQSAATGFLSVASASGGPSILSTAAVASSRSFGTRRANAAAAIANAEVGRSMANRVVSFTTNDLTVGAQSAPPMQENDGGGDSITMPDELDNFSDIADAFSNSARVWREEYEARLDAIHKRLS